MKNILTILILLITLNVKAQDSQSKFKWDIEKERLHNKNRNDSTKWSSKNWKVDTQNIKLNGRPIIKGVFPVPSYELIDSTFNGMGNSGKWKGIEFGEKKIIYHTFYVNKNRTNKEYIGNKQNEVFFSIVVLTDSLDLRGYTHTNADAISRNFPHYIGQGFVKTKTNEIDFVAFFTAERNGYAIINMRLFDLRIGRIIFIAPQKDKTLRSLQLNSEIMSSDENDTYIENLLKNNSEVINFFKKDGNI